MGKKVAAQGTADVTDPHGSYHPATIPSSICSCFGSKYNEFHWDSDGRISMRFSHPHTTRGRGDFCYKNITWSAWSIAAPVKDYHSTSPLCVLLIHCFIALFLSFSDAHQCFLFTALTRSSSLRLSAVSQCCAQPVPRGCWTCVQGGGWGLLTS